MTILNSLDRAVNSFGHKNTYPIQHDLFEASQFIDSEHWGFFSILSKEKGSNPRQKSYTLNKLPAILELVSKQKECDVWISQASFNKPNRRAVNLQSIGVLFVDLDYYKEPNLPNDPELMSQMVLEHCSNEGIPEPSVIINSGRGLQVKWFHTKLPAKALPVWNATEDAVVASFKALAADPAVRDVSRVLRVVNSINQKSGARVEIMHISWDEWKKDTPTLHDFNDFANKVLPFTREELKQLREDRASVKAAKEARKEFKLLPGGNNISSNLRRLSPLQLAWDRYQDIIKLAEIRHGGKVPEGERNQFLFWAINFAALNLYGRCPNFYHEAYQIAQRICPSLSQGEIRANLSTTYEKARQMARGEWIEFNGRKYPPLYTPRNDTLIHLLGITREEERQLTTVISKDIKRERHRARDIERLRAQGAIPRAEYEANAASNLKPWEKHGISRASWYRKGLNKK